jgi:hypothetical protein
MISDVSVYLGMEGMAEQSSSHHGGQEPNKKKYKGDKIQPPRTPPGTYFLQSGPASYLSLSPKNIII